jgi:hypothetical protein
MRTSRFFFLPLIAAATLAQPAAAQPSAERWSEGCQRSNWNSGDGRVTFCEVRESRIPARGSLRVDGAQNGGVSVRAHEGRDVIVRARVQSWARSDDAARNVARGVRVSTDGTVRATGPATSARNQGWAVSYEILVPSRTNLDVQTHNGPISVERLAGEMNLRAHNGPITLRELSGDVRARTQNGPLNVRLAGRRWSGEGLDAETVNGPVNVDMPRGYAARLESRTVHGPISAPAGIRPERSGRNRWSPGGSINTDINGGGPTIRVVTTNGPVDIDEI